MKASRKSKTIPAMTPHLIASADAFHHNESPPFDSRLPGVESLGFGLVELLFAEPSPLPLGG